MLADEQTVRCGSATTGSTAAVAVQTFACPATAPNTCHRAGQPLTLGHMPHLTRPNRLCAGKGFGGINALGVQIQAFCVPPIAAAL